MKSLLVLGVSMIALAQPPEGRRGGPGGFGPPGGPGGFGPPGGPGGFGGTTKLVKDHDKDGDSWLNKEERAAARAALAARPRRGPGGFGGFGRGGQQEPPQPGKKMSPAEVKQYGKEPLYDLSTLRTIFLEFDTPEWEAEMAEFKNTDVEMPVVMTVDGKSYKDVGVHFRGASSFMMVPAGRKRSLNISMDWANSEQRLGGYGTLNLLNSNGDPTMMRYILFSEIAKNYIPMPKANFVRVVINGEYWGIYQNVQQFNGEFVKEWFKGAAGGARWKAPGSPRGRAGLNYIGDNVADYKRIYEIKSKDNPKHWAALMNLTKVLSNTPPDKLEAALAPILDIDGALKFLALENVLVNSDGYWTRASDYNLYMEPAGKFHIIPHDVNETFRTPEGPGARGGLDLDPTAGSNDPDKALLNRLLAVPALKARYMGYVRAITEDWLDWKKLSPIVERWRALIAEDVKADTRKMLSTKQFFDGIDKVLEEEQGGGRGFRGPGGPPSTSLKQFVEQRRAALLARDDVKSAKR